MKRTTMVPVVFLVSMLAFVGSARAQLPDPPPPPAGTVIRTWNNQALDTARAKSLTDAQAARLYAMVNVAMYDAVWGIMSQFQGGRRQALVSASGAPSNGDLWAAAATAAHDVLSGLHPDRFLIYDMQLFSDIAAAPGGMGQVSAGQSWGHSVGSAVLSARASDGSSPSDTQPAGSGPGQFRASWSGVQFRNLAPFGIASSAAYAGAGPPALTSVDYAADFNEVKLLGNAAIPDAAKLAQFQFWNLPAGSSQPPGAWLQITLAVNASRPMPITETARLFTLVSIALCDTVAPTYQTKFTYRHWRPTTAIREADTDGNANTTLDASWSARAGAVGSSPEYWSGHSTFSGAAAQALAGFYCQDDISFSFTSDSAPGGTPRSYPSFSAAEREAGRSRVVGGLHFEFSDRDAIAAGHAVADEILANKLTRLQGATHFGHCPL